MDSLTSQQKVALFTGAGAFGGAALGSVESVWSIPKAGGVFPSFGTQLHRIGARSIAFSSAGFLFAAGEGFAHSVRSHDDIWNPFIGGLVAGIVPAVVKQNAVWGLGAGVAIGTAMAVAHYFESGEHESPLEKWSNRYEYLNAKEE
ncbi:unnamed protein product [Aphanomyces euteiches]|uniref:Uncharacterized protein n=1 Tax=Aphanomyces euteiches TaxID=100861 RepID=A0A6G0X0Q4_9STRA|nr:hypothetical protein Ae201684_009616 [Aphanomyces euteiches]KAH9085652.1 hypothetical protein Ae201684P_005357 [Aphanomyces euteiches]KAH9117000.1 hypothetical protein AeMF1_009102 [Aphanomyces euteiches]KAH9137940.1 hypothetical protein LEN26_005524 [Aphanomyces euteiches]KAH9157861.1 hypothetical protein AeRB84_000333 [Aphanomyces euteiches]